MINIVTNLFRTKAIGTLFILSILFALSILSARSHAQAQRVVSIDGSITETVYALEAEQTLVGVDTTSVYPAQARKLPNVGYMRRLSGEGILSLNPSLVITSEDAGPETVLENLRQAGLNIETIPSHRSIDGVISKVEAVSQVLNKQDQGQALASQIKTETTAILDRVAKHQSAKKPRVMFLLAMGGHGASIAGAQTQADAMISLMGGENIGGDFNSYKPMNPEGALKAAPDVIIIAERPDMPLNLDQYPALKLTQAYQNQRILRESSMLLLGFGPRIADAMASMATVMYPEKQAVITQTKQY